MDDLGRRLFELEPKLPKGRVPSFADLRALFEADRELFFGLVTIDDPGALGNPLRMLVRLARITALLARDGFEVVTRSNQYIAEGTRGGFLPLVDAEKDARFLEQLWSKSYLGDDFRGLKSAKGSAAEGQFFFEEFDWIESIRRMRLFRVDAMDASAVMSGLPRYHRLQLLDCAQEVVACPLIVGEGLRTDGPLKKGQAYYGRPQRRWLNDGTFIDAPAGKLFAVYADSEGSVYDWDWKDEAHCRPSSSVVANATTPRFRDADLRIDVAELIVGNVLGQEAKPFRKDHPWYSVAGDCVFCYFEDREAYEERFDEFLTKYVAFESGECVGFKLKYVSRLLDVVQKWSKQDDEAIVVHVQVDTVEVDLEFLMRAWLARSLPKRLPLREAMKLFEQLVRNPRPEKVVIPREIAECV